MKDWEKTLISPHTSIIDAISCINNNGLQVALVVDSDRKLRGIVTDGDIRLGLLKKISIESAIEEIMIPTPIVATVHDGPERIAALMRNNHVRHLPILDGKGRVVDLKVWPTPDALAIHPNWVVVMAGGVGSRLMPLTASCPKPMLKVGDSPVLETILKNLIACGFGRFYFSVNYLSNVIEDYFGDGSKWSVEIRYLREEKELGTVGSLSLITEKIEDTLLVMNGDLLTKVNFEQILTFHRQHHAMATMCVRENEFHVPYGVVDVEGHQILRVQEKPLYRLFINAGIYALEPEVLTLLPQHEYCDMPTLFDKIIGSGKNAIAFPIQEYWIDIGRHAELCRADMEFSGIFG